MSHDEAGTLHFAVTVSDLSPGMLFVDLDTDQNASTGKNGFDYSIGAAAVPGDSAVMLFTWDGSSWVEASAGSFGGGTTATGVGFTINKADLGAGPTPST